MAQHNSRLQQTRRLSGHLARAGRAALHPSALRLPEKAPAESGKNMELEIVVKRGTGQIAEVLLRGRVDTRTTDQFMAQIASLVEEGYRHILLNLRRVKFIDSAGLGSLIGVHRQLAEAGGSLRLVHLSPPVAKALELTRLSQFFSVHDNVQEAVTALARSG